MTLAKAADISKSPFVTVTQFDSSGIKHVFLISWRHRAHDLEGLASRGFVVEK